MKRPIVHIPKQKRKKLDKKADECLFVGYGETDNMKGYRVYNPNNNTVITVRDVIFDKNDSQNGRKNVGAVENTSIESDIEENETIVSVCFDEEEGIVRLNNAIDIGDNLNNQSSASDTTINNESRSDESFESNTASTEGETSYSTGDSSGNETEIENVPNIPSTSNNFCDVVTSNIVDSRTRSGSSASCAFLATSTEPTTYNEAINSENSHEWKQAMQEEFDSLVKNGRWELEMVI